MTEHSARTRPTPTTAGPAAPPRQTATFEGRPLPRPDEEVADQGLGFDVVTLMGRRRMLRGLGLGVVALGLAACGVRTDPTVTGPATAGEIPDEMAGPFPGDGSNGPDVLERSGIVRSDLRSSFGGPTGTAEGVPLALTLTITDLANDGAAFAGAAVYVWQCDREGRYSMYSAGVEAENYLRGVQIADADGTVRFTSIFPACYTGRWPHVHLEVYRDEAAITDVRNAIATSQLALPADACDAVYAQPGYEESVRNLAEVSFESDILFRDGGGASQLASVTGDVAGGYAASLVVGVDTTTTPTSGFPGGFSGGPGAGSGRPGT
jgi:protocatechuate 3,4-dioxygenase beta subunit